MTARPSNQMQVMDILVRSKGYTSLNAFCKKHNIAYSYRRKLLMDNKVLTLNDSRLREWAEFLEMTVEEFHEKMAPFADAGSENAGHPTNPLRLATKDFQILTSLKVIEKFSPDTYAALETVIASQAFLLTQSGPTPPASLESENDPI